MPTASAHLRSRRRSRRGRRRSPSFTRCRCPRRDDALEEDIGFRSVAVRGDEILLNGEPLFLRGVALHEEIDGRRAHSRSGRAAPAATRAAISAPTSRAWRITRTTSTWCAWPTAWALLLWLEIPVYQHIDFADARHAGASSQTMLAEMIGRDRNRAAVAFWGISQRNIAGRRAQCGAGRTGAARARTRSARRPVAAAFLRPASTSGIG